MKRLLSLSTILLVSAVVSCEPGRTEAEADSTAADLERALASLVPSSAPRLLLLVSPDDCFTCYTPVARWVDWGRRHPEEFRLVFARPPSEVEARGLTRLRLLPEAGTILRETPDVDTPVELVFFEGRLHYMSVISRDQKSSKLMETVGRSSISSKRPEVVRLASLRSNRESIR